MGKLVLGLLFAIIFIILIFGSIFWLSPEFQLGVYKTISKSSNDGDIPPELSFEFDYSTNPLKFLVLGKSDNGSILNLEYSFPKTLAGQKVTSEMVCEKGIKIRLQGENKQKASNIVEALSLVTPENQPILLTGMCENSTCKNIIGECELYLNKKNEN
jgi:hypothetical protein